MTSLRAAGQVLLTGTGALASLFGASMGRNGIGVVMLGTWPEALAAINRHGIRLVEPDGTEIAVPVRATDNPADCRGARFALVLVKSWQTARAGQQLSACLAPDGVALTLQNGHGNREILGRALGHERVALGVTTTGATLIGPGRVRPGGTGAISVERHPRLDPLLAMLRGAGLEVKQVSDAESLVWSKLVINAAINPLTALLDVPNGELLERANLRVRMAALAREAAAVAEVLGIPLTFSDPVYAAERVARQTAGNISSMLQDMRRGAPTEIEAICGAIVREGERTGVPTPINRLMLEHVRERVGISLEQVGVPMAG